MISVENLSKSFNGNPVLSNLSLQVSKGESLVIIGQSGCGKSVLLKHIMKLLRPDQGKVVIDGKNIFELNFMKTNEIRKRIGILFQSAALFDSLTVEENVGLGLKESRLYGKNEIENIVNEKLEQVGLTNQNKKYPAELSGGMRKRVGLARAISSKPEILLYDEPTTGLDPITADIINNMIVNLNKKLHVTSITVTHDMVSAYKIASRMVMLYHGRIQFDGSPDEIKNSTDPIVKQFISGSSKGPVKVI